MLEKIKALAGRKKIGKGFIFEALKSNRLIRTKVNLRPLHHRKFKEHNLNKNILIRNLLDDYFIKIERKPKVEARNGE
jgi:hypothetical protein